MAGNSILLAALSVLSACQQSKRSEVGWGVCVLQGGGRVLVCKSPGVCVCVCVCFTGWGEGLGL